MSVSLAHYEEALEAAAQVAVRRWAAADPPVPLLKRTLEQFATACSGVPEGGWTRKSSSYRLDHGIEAERVRVHAFRRPRRVLRRFG